MERKILAISRGAVPPRVMLVAVTAVSFPPGGSVMAKGITLLSVGSLDLSVLRRDCMKLLMTDPLPAWPFRSVKVGSSQGATPAGDQNFPSTSLRIRRYMRLYLGEPFTMRNWPG